METNLQFVAEPGLVVKLLTKSNTVVLAYQTVTEYYAKSSPSLEDPVLLSQAGQDILLTYSIVQK